MKNKFVFVILILMLVCVFFNNTKIVRADELSDNIEEQLQNIDLSQLENYFNSLEDLPNNIDFITYFNDIITGNINVEFDNIFSYIIKIFFKNIVDILPTFLAIIAIAILCGILQRFKSSFLTEGVSELILFISLLAIILLLTSEIIAIYKNTENIIKNIANLTEIMSPIILTLMIASGGKVSASVYKPTVAFLINIITNVFLHVIMPLIALIIIFNVINNISNSTKLDKFSEVASNLIKWIIGLIITIFTMFLSIQGITSATFDGISIKATKYAISNSVPIVGGLIRDGFDLVVAGSIIIKNVVGITCVFALFYTILVPILRMMTISLILKFVCAIIEPITDCRISTFCGGMSKCINYLSAVLISISFLLFVTILLITFSASSFI